MDILYFLKSHHDAIRASTGLLTCSDTAAARKPLLAALVSSVQIYLTLEKDYLYPELGGLFAGADALVSIGQANAAVVDKGLKAMLKAADGPDLMKRLGEFEAALLRHFEQEEQVLMPKMRALIRTEDREDLGQVFADVEAEVLGAVGLKAVVASAPGRKRA